VGVVVVVVGPVGAGVVAVGGWTVLGADVFVAVATAVTVLAAVTVGVPMKSPASDLTHVT